MGPEESLEQVYHKNKSNEFKNTKQAGHTKVCQGGAYFLAFLDVTFRSLEPMLTMTDLY
ncbi:hypothetical protein KTT_60540 [Tengunoibacter tsumagoiensis]|uniref:Uncharacterized protein n=1 Tax=Tengunoibacter tsumagoiensis TaxID=2014871 RepID=A0A402AB58_9CHLR|nr:hypothetical protein KTT_60540 [Tengunoibacter tsumagoiensis]